MPSTKNISIGFADIFIKAWAGDSTDNPFGVANTINSSSYTQLGYQIESGTTINLAEELYLVNVPEIYANVKAQTTQQGYTVEFDILESDLANMQYASNMFDYTAGAVAGTNPDVLKIGGGAATEYALLIIGDGPDQAGATDSRGYYCRKVVPKAGFPLTYKNGEEVRVKFMFEGLADRDGSVAEDEQFIRVEQVTTA